MNYKKSKIKKILIIVLGVSIIFYFLFSYTEHKNNKNLIVSFIDCGQADCILIKSPENNFIIIDFGDNKGLGDLSKRIPWWNKKIDLIIITHPHDDHIAGMISVINKYKVGAIMYTGVLHYSPNYLELLKIIEEKNIPLLIPSEGQVISLGDDCLMEIIFPWRSFAGKEVANLNNTSIISQLRCLGSSFLFTGDAEIEAEEEVLEKNINIKSDVLKAGHHGSITSSKEDFLEKVNPDIAIVMVGENNKFNHPSLRTIRRMEKMGIEVYRTDIHGTIDIINDGSKLYQKYSN